MDQDINTCSNNAAFVITIATVSLTLTLGPREERAFLLTE